MEAAYKAPEKTNEEKLSLIKAIAEHPSLEEKDKQALFSMPINEKGQTVLHVAVKASDKEAVKYLLNAQDSTGNALVDVNKKDANRKRPLDLATKEMEQQFKGKNAEKGSAFRGFMKKIKRAFEEGEANSNLLNHVVGATATNKSEVSTAASTTNGVYDDEQKNLPSVTTTNDKSQSEKLLNLPAEHRKVLDKYNEVLKQSPDKPTTKEEFKEVFLDTGIINYLQKKELIKKVLSSSPAGAKETVHTGNNGESVKENHDGKDFKFDVIPPKGITEPPKYILTIEVPLKDNQGSEKLHFDKLGKLMGHEVLYLQGKSMDTAAKKILPEHSQIDQTWLKNLPKVPDKATAENKSIDVKISSTIKDDTKVTEETKYIDQLKKIFQKEPLDPMFVNGLFEANKNNPQFKMALESYTESEEGKYALHKAISNVDVNYAVIDAIVKANPKTVDVEDKENNNSTPLHYAAYARRDDVYKLLESNKADNWIADKQGKTPNDLKSDLERVDQKNANKLLDLIVKKANETEIIEHITKIHPNVIKTPADFYFSGIKGSVNLVETAIYNKVSHKVLGAMLDKMHPHDAENLEKVHNHLKTVRGGELSPMETESHKVLNMVKALRGVKELEGELGGITQPVITPKVQTRAGTVSKNR